MHLLLLLQTPIRIRGYLRLSTVHFILGSDEFYIQVRLNYMKIVISVLHELDLHKGSLIILHLKSTQDNTALSDISNAITVKKRI